MIIIIMEIYDAPKLSWYTTALGAYNGKSFTNRINRNTHAHTQTHTHTHTHTPRACVHTHMRAHTHKEKEREGMDRTELN